MFYIKIPWLSSVLTFIKEPYQTRISICDVYVNLVIKKEKYVLGRTVHMSSRKLLFTIVYNFLLNLFCGR